MINSQIFAPNSITIGRNSINSLIDIIKKRRKLGSIIVIIDKNFYIKNINLNIFSNLSKKNLFIIEYLKEPDVNFIDNLKKDICLKFKNISTVIGIGGGSTLDTAKSISNLLNNPGSASKYQGWDLLKNNGVYKIGVPTLFGTGAESSKTCVITNNKTLQKLGMNSKYSVFDSLVLDPYLCKTVDMKQYFYTAMDTFIHSIESLSGKYRNPYSDYYSNNAKNLIEKIFLSSNSKSEQNRTNLMLASYFGGLAISSSFVGLIHPISAALSVVYGLKHCYANCITFKAVKEYYPSYYKIFNRMCINNNIKFKKLIHKLSDDDFEKLTFSTLIHEKPLANALGNNFKKILSKDKLRKIFSQI